MGTALERRLRNLEKATPEKPFRFTPICMTYISFSQTKTALRDREH